MSASEGSRELFSGFVPGTIPGVALFRKTTQPVVAPPPVPVPVPIPEPVPLPVNVERALAVVPPDHAADARRLANEGNLAEALAACDRALAEDKLVAAHHYLRGVILQEQNAPDEAIAAMKRALYLDHDFALAHFALGHLRLRQGRAPDAARSFANATALLRAYTPETVLPGSGGITAGRLLAIIAGTEEALA